MKKETEILETAMSLFFMICHIIMMVQVQPDSNLVYFLITGLFGIASLFLVGRIAYFKNKNKRNNKNSGAKYRNGLNCFPR